MELKAIGLANFILSNAEPILAEWDTFAGSLLPGKTMTKRALRDDAEEILATIARGMQDEQSLEQQASKSKGHGGANTVESDRLDDVSVRHAGDRIASGFNVDEVISEFRALRASILRLWRASLSQPDFNDIDDITRFNEAIDQALAESVASYTKRVNRSRNIFLAMLGHDLLNPLNCIRMGAHLGAQKDRDPDPAEAVETLSIIATESDAMEKLIGDLIDFSSTWLGSSLPLNREPVDLQKLCDEVVRGFRAMHPERMLHFHHSGDLTGIWDAARLRQALSNLLCNAFQHGCPEHPVELAAASKGANVVVSVHNEGKPIPRKALPTLFDPLVRHASLGSSLERTPGSIGLGLYIVREIINANEGKIEVASTARKGTTFTFRIPRQPRPGVEDEERSEARRPIGS